MEKYFHKKLNILLLFLLTLVAGFFVLAGNISAITPEEELKNEENIKLSEIDSEKIWLSVGQTLTNEWIDLASSAYSTPEKEAVLSIIRTGRKAKLIKYFFSDTPKDASIKLIDATIRLVRIFISGDTGQVIGEIERLSVEEAKKYITDYLDRNKIKVSSGNLPIQYRGWDNNPYSYKLPYIIALKENDTDKFEIAVGVYSSKIVKTLKPQIISGWTGDIENLQPYIFRLSGEAKRENGSFSWIGKPTFEYIFNESVPEFDFKEPGFWDNTKNYFNDFLKDINPFSSNTAQVVTEIPGNEDTSNDVMEESGSNLGQSSGQLLEWSQTLKENINLFLKSIKLTREEKEKSENAEKITSEDNNNSKELSLEDIQEQIDDISEQIDILLAEYAKLFPDKFKDEDQEENNDKELTSDELSKSLGSKDKIHIDYPKLLITEVQTKGASGEKDEFVEIYNPNNFSIVLTDWYVQRKTKNSISYLSYATSTNFQNKFIKANGYLLIARKGSALSNISEIIVDKSLTDDNALVLKNPNGDIVDKVGWGTANEYETEPTLNHQAGKSIGRILVEMNQFKDTDNNKNDFEINKPTPYGKENGPDNPQVDPQKILISEIQTGANEFLELYNPNKEAVDISNYYFSYYSSTHDWNDPYRNKKFPDEAKIEGNGYYLVGFKGYPTTGGSPNSDWQPYTSCFNNTQGSVAIFPWNPIEKTAEEAKVGKIDAVGWGETRVFESEAIKKVETGRGLARKIEDEEMIDTDNNDMDFIIGDPTPTNSTFEANYKPIFDSIPWSGFQKDSSHSGQADSFIFDNNNDLKQNLIKTFGISGGYSPKITIGPENNIYVITDEKSGDYLGKIYAFSSSGDVLWTFSQFDEIPEHIVLSRGGNVYVATSKKVYAFDLTTGENKWTYVKDGVEYISGISVDESNGRIYFTDYTGLYCLNSSGKERWLKKDAPRGGSALGGPTIGRDGTIYVSWAGFRNTTDEERGSLFAYNPGGTLKWQYLLDFGVGSVPVITGEGNVYVIAGASSHLGVFRYIYEFDKDGNLLWQSAFETGSIYAPVINNRKNLILTSNGSEFAGESSGTLVYRPVSKVSILNSDNSIVWEEETEKNTSIDSQPIAGSSDLFVVIKTIYEEDHASGFIFKPIRRELRIYNSSGIVYKLNVDDKVLPNVAVNSNGEIYALAVNSEGILKLISFMNEQKLIEPKLEMLAENINDDDDDADLLDLVEINTEDFEDAEEKNILNDAFNEEISEGDEESIINVDEIASPQENIEQPPPILDSQNLGNLILENQDIGQPAEIMNIDCGKIGSEGKVISTDDM